jgi:multisubunit Na+/H+ antiporter MnhB subunit
MKNETGMTLIVKTVTRLTTGLIMIYGIYIILHGHVSPGGGFAGGVIIALSLIHLTLAFGKEALARKFTIERGVFLMSLAALIYLISCVLGFTGKHQIVAGTATYRIFSADLIPLSDISAGLMVGIGLFVIFMLLVSLADREER